MPVKDSSIKLTLVQKPERFRAVVEKGAVSLVSSPMQVTARCVIAADPQGLRPPKLAPDTKPRTAPWKLGFMQIQVFETAWAYYRGAEKGLGCVLNDKAAKRELKVCRDYEPDYGVVWYEGSKNMFECYGMPNMGKDPPWPVEFYFGDNPKHEVDATVLNGETNRTNYLHEARCAMAFITTLTEQIKEGVYQHHRHFLWSAIWHILATSKEPQKKNTEFQIIGDSGFWISDFKRGAPKDPSFLKSLNDPHLTLSCNEVADSAPVDKSTASTWTRFKLMDQKPRMFPAK